MDVESLVNLLSGSWRASYTYGTSDLLESSPDAVCTIQMHARRDDDQNGNSGANNPHALHQHDRAIAITASGCDEAGPFDVTGSVWKVDRTSEQYVFEFQKVYENWRWVQWGLLVGRSLEGYWGEERGDFQGCARYEKLTEDVEESVRARTSEGEYEWGY